MVGPEGLLTESLLLGGDGGVCGGANLHPRLLVRLYEAAKERDLERVDALRDELFRIRETVYSQGSSKAKVIQSRSYRLQRRSFSCKGGLKSTTVEFCP